MTFSFAAHAAVSGGDVGVAKKKFESAAEEEASKRREAEEQVTRKREEGAAKKQKEEEVEARARAAVMLHVCVRACMWVGGWWCGGFYRFAESRASYH